MLLSNLPAVIGSESHSYRVLANVVLPILGLVSSSHIVWDMFSTRIDEVRDRYSHTMNSSAHKHIINSQ